MAKNRKRAKNTLSKSINTKSSGSQPTGRQQVRIIGGHYKSRKISFNDTDGLRPTPDRLRETLFNWLMADTFDALVLDACAGSGVLGFEALSRGACHVTFIEADKTQATILQDTAKALRLDKDNINDANEPAYQIIHAQAEKVIPNLVMPKLAISGLATAKTGSDSLKPSNDLNLSNVQSIIPAPKFNIVFIDPPYALQLCPIIIDKLLNNDLVDNNTLLYIEDNQPIELTLQDVPYPYDVLKTTHIGQVTGSLIRLTTL